MGTKTIVGIAAAGVLALGGIAPVIPYTDTFEGSGTVPQFSTPSGNLDIGYWSYLEDGSSTLAHYIDATSTEETVQDVPQSILKTLTQVHLTTYTQKDVYRTKSGINTLVNKGTPAPVEMISAAQTI